MPHSSKNLESYKTEIIFLFQNNNSSSVIARILLNKYDLKVTSRTIESRLQNWRIRKYNRTATADTILHARIRVLFFEVGLEEKDLLRALQNEGFEITARILRRLRHQLGLQRRTNPVEAQQQTDEIIQAVEEELEKGIIEGYGKELLHRHFRSKGFMIAR
jgi:DNA polymerase III delta prime subunit